MKNNYCDLSQEQINDLPDRFRGLLLSPFQHNLKRGWVHVPEETFKEMVDLIAEFACLPNPQQSADRSGG